MSKLLENLNSIMKQNLLEFTELLLGSITIMKTTFDILFAVLCIIKMLMNYYYNNYP